MSTTLDSVPSHVPTWAYDDGCNGGRGASASLVDQWLSYAESHCGGTDTKSLTDCTQAGVTYCTPVEYLDTNWIYPKGGSEPIAGPARESWWLHEPGYTDSAHRISVSSYGGGDLLNQTDPAVQNWFRNDVRTNYNAWPALMMDDSSAGLSVQLYGTGSRTTDELSTDAQLQAEHEGMAAAMTHTDGTPFLQIDNSIPANPWLTMPFAMLNKPSSVQGLVAEGQPMDNGTMTGAYPTLLDEMAYVDKTADDFIVLLSYDSTGSLRARRVQEASEMLGYSQNHVVSWADLEQGNTDLAVWPEEGVVPTRPVQSMAAPGGTDCLAGQGVECSSGGHNSLELAAGVYGREFGNCYDHGVAFGDCAAIVNTNSSPVTVRRSWLTQRYGHQITMTGGDVQSGGTINTTDATFTPGVTTIAANDAILLAS